jgi:hypothetical protein
MAHSATPRVTWSKGTCGASLRLTANRARGERAKREAEPGALEATDVDVIDVSAYHPPRIPSKKWRELIKKVWEVDPLICQHCGAEMKLIALIDDDEVIEKIATPLRSVAVRIRTARLPSVGSPAPEAVAAAGDPGLFVPRPAEYTAARQRTGHRAVLR